MKKANRRVLEALIRSGALDELGPNRATLMAQLPLAIKLADQHTAMEAAGQNDLFGIAGAERAISPVPETVHPAADWEEDLRLQGEKETLGLYLTGHPIDRFESDLAELDVTRLDVFSGDGREAATAAERARVAGYVVAVNRRPTQRGYMASVLLDDRKGRIEAVFFTEAYEVFRDLLTADRVLVVEGSVARDDFRGGLSLRAERAMPLEALRVALATQIRIAVDAGLLRRHHWRGERFVDQLARHLAPFRGGTCQVVLDYAADEASGSLVLADEWRVEARDELLRQLRNLFGRGRVSVNYRRERMPAGDVQPREGIGRKTS